MSPTTNNEQVETSSCGVDVPSKKKNSGDEVIGNDGMEALAKGLVRSYSSEVVFPCCLSDFCSEVDGLVRLLNILITLRSNFKQLHFARFQQ